MRRSGVRSPSAPLFFWPLCGGKGGTCDWRWRSVADEHHPCSCPMELGGGGGVAILGGWGVWVFHRSRSRAAHAPPPVWVFVAGWRGGKRKISRRCHFGWLGSEGILSVPIEGGRLPILQPAPNTRTSLRCWVGRARVGFHIASVVACQHDKSCCAVCCACACGVGCRAELCVCERPRIGSAVPYWVGCRLCWFRRLRWGSNLCGRRHVWAVRVRRSARCWVGWERFRYVGRDGQCTRRGCQ